MLFVFSSHTDSAKTYCYIERVYSQPSNNAERVLTFVEN